MSHKDRRQSFTNLSIPAYYHPQSTLTQFLANINAAEIRTLNPLCVGPQYRLSRYGKETTPTAAFAAQSSSQVLPWRYLDGTTPTTIPGAEIVDLSFTRLFGQKLEATLATFLTGDSQHFTVLDFLHTATLKLSSGHTAGSGLATKLHGRPVAVGDLVYITTNSGTVRRVVTALPGVTLAATYGTNVGVNNDSNSANSQYNPATAAASHYTCLSAPDIQAVGVTDTGVALTVLNPDDFKGTLQGAHLDGAFGEQFTLTVTTGGDHTTAVATITSASGLYSGTITSTNANAGFHTFSDVSANGSIMAGLQVCLDDDETGGDLTSGWVYVFTVTSKYTRVSAAHALLSGTFDGAVNTTYLVEVTNGGTYNSGSPTATGAVVRISDTSNVNAPVSVTLTNDTNFALGTSGLSMKFNLAVGWCPQGGLRKGDVYYVNCVAPAESTTDFDKVVCDGPVIDSTVFTNYSTSVQVEFRLPFTGEIAATSAADEEAWTVNASTGLTVQSGLSLPVTARSGGYTWCPFINAVGTLALYFRALQPPALGEGLLVINTPDEALALCGVADVDNDLGKGVLEMLNGSLLTGTVYALRTSGITAAHFTAALGKSQNTKLVYAIAPMTTDPDAIVAVGAHVNAMSSRTKKHFRRCYVGTDSPGAYPALKTLNSANLLCVISDYNGAGNLRVSIQNSGLDLSLLNLAAGDQLKLIVAGTSYGIASVLSASELILSAGPGAPVGAAVVCEIWYADTPESQARFVRARSRLYGNRRVVNIWAEGGTASGLPMPNRYVAAHIAGLRCALLPQQGLTRTQVTTIDSATPMQLRYSDDLLDLVAADGTCVVTQDAESGAVYIRHQLTTDTTDGALAYEDSVGVVADVVSFVTDAIVDAFIGKRNVTQSTLIDLRNRLEATLLDSTQSNYGEQAGPLIIRFEDLKITPNPILKDRVKITFKCVVALPFNNADTYITFDQDVTISTVVQ